MSESATRTVACVLYPRLTALDVIGPYEVLQRVPSFEPVFVGHAKGEVRTENGFLGLTVDATFDEVPSPDVIVVPGGIGSRAMMTDEPLLEWIRSAHATSELTTSVCTGSLLLGAAGLLDGLTATTHWGAVDALESTGARYVPDRVVEHIHHRIVMAAGVSSGIDMALRVLEMLEDATAAEASQLMIEYDPQPPFDTGSMAKATAAGPHILERVRAYSAVRQ